MANQQGGNSGGNKKQEQQSGQKEQQGGGRGFAGMDPDKQREIAAEGGRASHGGQSGQQGGGGSDGRQASQEGGGRGQQGDGRGFAGMDPDKQREIAAEGGRAAHASGNAHEFSSEEAREAGSKSHGGGGKSGGR